MAKICPIEIKGQEDPLISSIVYDSRHVVSGSLFFALNGVHNDGHAYINEALSAGALAVVFSSPLPYYSPGIVYIQVEDTRKALSPISAAFWDYPSEKMILIGVTGTDGKSTTVSLIRQLLELEGKQVGQISTVSFKTGEEDQPNALRQSTPEAPELHELLHSMKESGKKIAVIEATSHGLSPRNSRLADVAFDAAVLTNVTEEHLDFHGDLLTYRQDKARLFTMIAESSNTHAFAVLNADDPYVSFFLKAAGKKSVFCYSRKNNGSELFASDVQLENRQTRFTLHTTHTSVKTSLNLPGLHNVENALAALCTVSKILDKPAYRLAPQLPFLIPVEGRMEFLSGNMGFKVLVDYAHSPGSFSKLLPFLKRHTEGQLILVFGSAGERDLEKRPQQGALAAEYADLVILTNEDPRGEDPMKILDDIALGIPSSKRGDRLFLIPDRQEALRTAFERAHQGDLVATLGKGHEKSLIIADKSVPWDEKKVCLKILRSLGYRMDPR